ncbi:MAG: phenylalanine--tRNA ligase subunit beta [Candidatus Berkelbacteria bacterium]
MKISKNWLKDYIEINEDDDKLVDHLNATGTEVDEMISSVVFDDKVVVAEILKIDRHPNADRLQIATVTDGSDEFIVVCGAPNIAVGQKVPFAKIGAKLPDFEIKKAEIRGVESFGMLCAADELGLGTDHSGIIILEKECELGQPYSHYIKGDTVFDLEITTNRGDCLNHIGMAREIAVFEELPEIQLPTISLSETSEEAKDLITVTVEDSMACPQYTARVVKNIKIGPSPEWLRERLVACGVRSINNVVDITNYIMLDLGQPLHAFDLKKVAKGKIEVRFARTDETILTLDGALCKLTPEVLVIADIEKPIAIAGIMGGAESEIDEKTVDIVIEAAEFDRKVVRRGKKIINISSEASYRFERGIDSEKVEYALNKAAKMMSDLCSGEIAKGIVSAGNQITRSTIKIEYDKIATILGLDISAPEMDSILTRLGFSIDKGVATIPSWRHDILLWQDLIEEVGRIHGYDKIKPLPLVKIDKPEVTVFAAKEYLKDLLVECGFSEVKNYSFMSEKDTALSGLDCSELLEVANPLQPENKYMRPTLLPLMLKNVAQNSTFDPILIFEIGQVFTSDSEKTNLTIIASGKNAKSEIDTAVKTLTEKVPALRLDIESLETDRLNKYKIRKPAVYFIDLDLSAVCEKIKVPADISISSRTEKNITYRPVSKYPSVTRDLAFIVDKDLPSEDLVNEIYGISPEINRVELFDEFASDKFGENKKNVAYHIYLQYMDRTMSDADADAIVKSIIEMVEEKHHGQLRK